MKDSVLKYTFWILFLSIISVFSLSAQSLRYDSSFISDVGMTWGYCVRQLETGEVLFQKDADRLMTPASNIKVITTGVALDVLGGDYRFQTQVGLVGHLEEDAIWDGDMVIVAGGDPTLGSDHWPDRPVGEEVFQKLIERLKDREIEIISGDILLYTGRTDDRSHHPSWPWSDIANYFGIGARAINFNDNSYSLYFDRSYIQGDQTEVLRTSPPVDYHFENKVTVGAPGSVDQAWIYGAPWDKTRVIKGSIPPGRLPFEIKGSVGDPVQWFGTILKEELREAGIAIQGRVRIVKGVLLEEHMDSVHSWFSPELRDIVRVTNRESVNMFAEALLKALARAKGKEASTETGVRVLEEYLRRDMSLPRGYFIVDGSGLSHENALSTALITAFICMYFDFESTETSIDEFLPEVGSEGTVSNLPLIGGKAWLKSGTLGQSKGYSGIIQRENGDFVSCSVLVNHYGRYNREAVQLIHNIIQAIVYSDS